MRNLPDSVEKTVTMWRISLLVCGWCKNRTELVACLVPPENVDTKSGQVMTTKDGMLLCPFCLESFEEKKKE